MIYALKLVTSRGFLRHIAPQSKAGQVPCQGRRSTGRRSTPIDGEDDCAATTQSTRTKRKMNNTKRKRNEGQGRKTEGLGEAEEERRETEKLGGDRQFPSNARARARRVAALDASDDAVRPSFYPAGPPPSPSSRAGGNGS